MTVAARTDRPSGRPPRPRGVIRWPLVRRRRYGPQRLSLCPQGAVISRMASCSAEISTELAVVAAPEPEGDLAAEVSAAGLLVGLGLSDALTDAVALCLGEGGGDRQEELRQAVAGNVAAQIERVELHPLLGFSTSRARRGLTGTGDRAWPQ